MLPINDPAVVAEVKGAFEAYERALTDNDVAALDRFFWADERAVRYGVAENLHGHAEIAAYRASQPAMLPGRKLERTVVTTFGGDAATVSTLFRCAEGECVGRQMQTWVRMSDGWRIVAAHVSRIEG